MDTTAHVRRSGDWWAVEVPDVPGLFTQVRRLEQVADYVRDAAAGLGVDIADVKVEVDPSDNLDLEALAIVRQHLAALERMQREVANESRHLAAHLRDQGLSVRDTGFLMGVSAQRVSQLTAEEAPPATPTDIERTWSMIAEAARSGSERTTARTGPVRVKVTTTTSTKSKSGSKSVRIPATVTSRRITSGKTKADAIAKVKEHNNPSGRKVHR